MNSFEFIVFSTLECTCNVIVKDILSENGDFSSLEHKQGYQTSFFRKDSCFDKNGPHYKIGPGGPILLNIQVHIKIGPPCKNSPGGPVLTNIRLLHLGSIG